MFCQECGTDVNEDAKFCPKCGNKIALTESASHEDTIAKVAIKNEANTSNELVYPKTPPTSPHFAWLSLIIPGIPQLVFGQKVKGIAIIVVYLITLASKILPAIILIASIIDAYKVGNALKAGRPVGQWEFFP